MEIHGWLCGVALVLALRACAQPEILPPSALERVPMIVAMIDPAQPETLVAAETELVALGTIGVGSVRQLYLTNQASLQQAEDQGRWFDAWNLQARVQVFSQALTRLQTGFDPAALIRAWAQQQAPGQPLPDPVLLRDPDLERGFPRAYLYAVRPSPFADGDAAPPSCLFAVARDGSVTRIGTVEELKQFFLANLPPLRSLATKVKGQPPGDMKDASRNALRLWQRLSQALQGDGYFRFTPLETITVDEQPGDRKTGPTLRATGQVTALPDGGNRGALAVTLEFTTRAYRLADVQETAALQPGLRPDIMQLLSPIPAMRRQAEESLLQMGPPALDYLAHRRAQARPELQQAIDALYRYLAAGSADL